MLRKEILFIITFTCLLLNPLKGQIDSLGKVLVKAKEMPHTKKCSEKDDQEQCTQNELAIFFKNKMIYPKAAIEKKIEGTVIISCIINNKGKIVQPNILYDIGGNCGKEALRLVKMLPPLVPAKEDSKNVNVIYNIEVPFALSDIKEKETSIIYEEPTKPIIPKNDEDLNLHLEEESFPSETIQTDLGEVYIRTDQMPYFNGCDGMINKTQEKRNCSDKKLVSFLSSNLIYPEEAKRNEIEGVVYVSFIIDETGNLIQPKVIRDIGGGCGEEALRVVQAMPLWEAGKEKGIPVKVKMNLPVKFSLSSNAADKYQIHWGNLRTNKISVEEILEAINEDLVVRNIFGDDVTISFLNISYQKNSKIKEESSTGKITFAMMRLLRKVKPSSYIIIMATIQEKGEMIDISRKFRVIK